MAKTETAGAPVPETAAAPIQAVADVQAPEGPPEKVKKERNILIPLLTVLLIIVGIGELGLVGFLGISAYRGIQEKKAYEAQLEAEGDEEPDTVRTTAVASYVGPWRRVEAGTVVWTWEEDYPPGATLGQDQTVGTGTGGAQVLDEYPRTPSSPPDSWITLADPDARPAS